MDILAVAIVVLFGACCVLSLTDIGADFLEAVKRFFRLNKADEKVDRLEKRVEVLEFYKKAGEKTFLLDGYPEIVIEKGEITNKRKQAVKWVYFGEVRKGAITYKDGDRITVKGRFIVVKRGEFVLERYYKSSNGELERIKAGELESVVEN